MSTAEDTRTDKSPMGFSPTAQRLVELLREHTPFAEAIVRRQAERAGFSCEKLVEGDLLKLGPMIAAATAMFVDQSTLATLRVRLLPLR